MEAITGSLVQISYIVFLFYSSRFVYDAKGVCSSNASAMFLDIGGRTGQ